MYCSRCGKQNEDNAAFCIACGAPLAGPVSVPIPDLDFSLNDPNVPSSDAEPVSETASDSETAQGGVAVQDRDAVFDSEAVLEPEDQEDIPATALPAAEKPVKKKKKRSGRLKASLMVVFAVLLGALLGVTAFGAVKLVNNTGEEAVKRFVTILLGGEGDGKQLLDLFHERVTEAVRDQYDLKESELAEGLDLLRKAAPAGLDAAWEDWELRFSTVDEFTAKDLRELQQRYKDDYGLDLKPDDAVTVTMQFTGKPFEGDEIEEEWELTAVKLGGRWYMDAQYLFTLHENIPEETSPT